jgi:hypothetical protein
MSHIEKIGNCKHRVVSIYALCDYPSMEPRYIGKTSVSLGRRLSQHISASNKKRLPVHRWINKRIASGRTVVIDLIEVVNNGDDWAAREREWIKRLRENGRSLNLTDGGEGLSGHVFSEEHRRKISDAIKTGEFITCEQCGNKAWRKPSEIKKGDSRFCSKVCYQKSQIGVSKPVSDMATKKGIKAAAIKRLSMTHCKRGHLLSGENLFITSKGGRGCKECRKVHKAKYRAKQS